LKHQEVPGRPTRPGLNGPEPYYAIGVRVHTDRLIALLLDLDGAVVDLGIAAPGVQGHNEGSSLRTHPEATDVATVVDAMASMVDDLFLARSDLRDHVVGLGISIGGHVDREAGIVRLSPDLGWADVRLAERVHEATGFDNVAVENDVNVLVDAEQWSETGGRYQRFAVVKIGTGIGCGLSLHRGLERGATGAAGELGHIPFERGDGRRCVCGKRGCLETVASAKAILQEIRELGGPDIEMEAAADRARAGDELCIMAFRRAGEALGIGLSVLLNLINLEAVILCGDAELLKYDPYIQAARESLGLHAFSSTAEDCDLLVEVRTDELEARGAASMALGHLADIRGGHSEV
jgi:predicted NBD/HSP70 family sugar kinase